MNTQAFSKPAALGFAMEGLRRELDEATIAKYGADAQVKMNTTIKSGSEKRAGIRQALAVEIYKNIQAAK